MSAARILVYLPSLLEQAAGGERELELSADSLQGAIDTLLSVKPELAIHLFDESGTLRQHVNLFLNDRNVRWLDDWSVALEEGDILTVLQAVSGG